MARQYWSNGRFLTNWFIEENLRKLNVNPDDFNDYLDLVSYLFNMELDHSNMGKLDDVGLDIQNVIREVEMLNR